MEQTNRVWAENGYRFRDPVIGDRYTVVGLGTKHDIAGYLIENVEGERGWAHPDYVHCGEPVATQSM